MSGIIDAAPGARKRLAQVAAVIGRDFSITLLEKLSHLTSDALEDDLVALVRTGLVETTRPGAVA